MEPRGERRAERSAANRGVAPGTTPTGSFGTIVVRLGQKPQEEQREKAATAWNEEEQSDGTEGGVSPFHRGSAAGSARVRERSLGENTGSPLRAALVVLERIAALRDRDRGLVLPGIHGKMVDAAAFGRLLNDLGIDCSPHGFRSSFPVVVFGRGARPRAGGTGTGSLGREPGRAVLCAQRLVSLPRPGRPRSDWSHGVGAAPLPDHRLPLGSQPGRLRRLRNEPLRELL